MARPPSNSSVSEPTSQGVGTPPGRQSDIALVEIAKIQSDGEYIKRDLSELRSDMRDLRDRMAKLEVRVDHLPTKSHIVTVTAIALTLIGGLLTIAPKLQSLAGTSVQAAQVNHP
ncbi:DUF2730 family protein [Bradyrhizobium sp. Tv2a-2]|uniref:DUF2730 family protein n=1 Tax=Bradyrhizobium sp. Tv2a-2 TaxID=113395 RepID=UPI0004661905|nr:DUF2730 family protein [Bradyrhizobium sp. Tv2a-2]